MAALDFSDPSYRALVEALRSSGDEVFGRIERRIGKELEIYDRVGAGPLRSSVETNLEITAHMMTSGGQTPPRELSDQLDDIIAQRIQVGITTDQMIQGHNIVMAEVLKHLIELGEELEVPVETTLEASQFLWTASHAVLQRATALIQRRMIELAMREQTQRAEFLRDLVAGQLASPTLEVEAAVHGLDPDKEYVVLRARPRHRDDAERLTRAVQVAGSRAGGAALVAMLGRDCVGVIPAGVPISPEAAGEAAVGFGPPALLADISTSFAVAGRILGWMVRHDVVGTKTLADLSWRLMVDPVGDVEAHLVQRFLTPLEQESTIGPVIAESLRAYLAHDRHIGRAASSLVVHPNTLRHRLRRYAELTGVDLESTEDLIGLAWALEV